MAGMVALTVGLRFLQEARADAVAKLEAINRGTSPLGMATCEHRTPIRIAPFAGTEALFPREPPSCG